MTKDDLHALCRSLSLPLSGNKNELMFRVAGVLSSEEKAWGMIKSPKRGNRNSLPSIPTFSENDSELMVSAETIQTSENISQE